MLTQVEAELRSELQEANNQLKAQSKQLQEANNELSAHSKQGKNAKQSIIFKAKISELKERLREKVDTMGAMQDRLNALQVNSNVTFTVLFSLCT